MKDDQIIGEFKRHAKTVDTLISNQKILSTKIDELETKLLVKEKPKQEPPKTEEKKKEPEKKEEV